MARKEAASGAYEYGPLPEQHSPFFYAGHGPQAMHSPPVASPAAVPLMSPNGAPSNTPSATSSMQEGRLGKNIFRLTGSLRWWILVLLIYAIATIAVAAFILTCPSSDPVTRVLPSGSLRVDQFLSGLLLSVVLTPAAIAIRKTASELALLYPFAIASRKPTRLDDIERLREGGLASVFHLFRYSPITGIVQGLLNVVGAVLVPVGTLLIFTGTFTSPDRGIATVGMPVAAPSGNEAISMYSGMDTVWFEMGGTYSPDVFMNQSQQTYRSLLTAAGGALPYTPAQLGPYSTANLSYVAGVRYTGIVTFTWASNCQPAKDQIEWTTSEEKNGLYHNFTFPDGTTNVNHMATRPRTLAVIGQTHKNITVDAGLANITDINSYTMYYGIVGTDEGTVNLAATKNKSSDVFESRQIDRHDGLGPQGYWCARVACKPTFNWQLSSCVYNGTDWTDCHSSPHANPTALDTRGLDHMVFYMTGLPTALQFSSDNDLSGLPPMQYALQYDAHGGTMEGFRAPELGDWEFLYGSVARALAQTATTGMYGAVEVPTLGSPARPAYLVRVYILAIVLVMLLGSPALAILWLCLSIAQKAPLRKATILTAGTALRGPAWDATFHGGCAMGDDELARKMASVYVRHGVDPRTPQHIGLAHEVWPIRREERYWGVGAVEQEMERCECKKE